MSEITIGGRRFAVHQFTGKVAQANKRTETRIAATGGGSDGAGGTRPMSIASATVTHDDVFLVDDGGQEKLVRLEDWNVGAREGNELHVVWVIDDKGVGHYVYIHNRNTRVEQWGADAMRRIFKVYDSIYGYGFAMIGGFVAGGIVSVVLRMGIFAFIGAGAGIWLLWRHDNRGRQMIERMKAELRSLLPA